MEGQSLLFHITTFHNWKTHFYFIINTSCMCRKFFGTDNPYADLMYCMKDQISLFKAGKIKEEKVKEKPFERELELTLEEVEQNRY